MKTINDDTILDCGHKPSPHCSSVSTGYGTDEHGATACFDCCAKIDIRNMIETGRATLYLKRDPVLGCFVANWPGTLSILCASCHEGRHNIARTRCDVWFRGPDGKNWHGVQYGDFSQICHCRRLAK